jgi:isoquinoline 1-oxidoreductase subunit alpha
MPVFSLVVNNGRHSVEASSDMPLLWVLRDLLHFTGTKYGCGMGVCGACTVHQDGIAVRSCQIPLAAAVGKRYITIEGLSADGNHPCQKAWIEEDVSQCGYCQAGMIMEAVSLIQRKRELSDAEIDAEMSDHVCRCGTFQRLRRAIRRAAREVNKT